MNRVLLIVDPQNSFCDPQGELFVSGADRDMERLSTFIKTHGHLFSRIVVTMDSHNRVHIAHPIWWVDKEGNHPAPFTPITQSDVASGEWMAANTHEQAWAEHYVRECGTHMIWPPHCIMGTKGHQIYAPLEAALSTWADTHHDLVLKPKGNARNTEHFSIFSPKVSRENDPSTAFDTALLENLDTFDEIYVAGEASSHCVADSVRDLVVARPAMATKVTLLRDAMSPVTDFEGFANSFFAEMEKAGVRCAKTTDTPA